MENGANYDHPMVLAPRGMDRSHGRSLNEAGTGLIFSFSV